MNNQLFEDILKIPVIDVHSHLDRDAMSAGTLSDILLYHMVRYPLRSSGLDQAKLWETKDDRCKELEPYDDFFSHWPQVANTGFGWIVKRILKDLYGFDEPLTRENFPGLKRAFEAKTAAPDWPKQVMDKGRIKCVLSSSVKASSPGAGRFDGGIRFTVECLPVGGGNEEWVTWPKRVDSLSRQYGKEILTHVDLQDAVNNFYGRTDWSDKHALVAWVSSQADFRPVPSSVIDSLLETCRNGVDLTTEHSAILEGALLRAVCRAIIGKVPIFQICYGVQYVTPGAPHPTVRERSTFAADLAFLFGEFPQIHFNLLSGCESDEHVLCGHCLAYENVSLSSFWWYHFYPSLMSNAWERRLDMVPASRLCGFFSDGRCVDWLYGRVLLSKRALANALGQKVNQGIYSHNQAVGVAREVLFDTPKRIFGLPRINN